MNESEINELVSDAFTLGYVIAIQAMTGESAGRRDWSDLWKLLHEVADGETTLTDTVAETLMNAPRFQGTEKTWVRFTNWQNQEYARLAKRVVAAVENS